MRGAIDDPDFHVGRGHHRQVDAGPRIAQIEGSCRRAGHRQGKHEAGLVAPGIDAVAEPHGHRARLFGAPSEPVRALDELHRAAVHARLAQCRAGRQDRHQGPFVLEGFDPDGDVDRGGDAILAVAHMDDDVGLADGVGGRRGTRVLGQLIQHRRVVRERHPDLARVLGRVFPCRCGRCQDEGEYEEQSSHGPILLTGRAASVQRYWIGLRNTGENAPYRAADCSLRKAA